MKVTSATRRSMHRHLVAAIVVVLVLVVGVGGWAATTAISGAVVASGSVVVDSNVKKVQHPTGGIVGERHQRPWRANGAQGKTRKRTRRVGYDHFPRPTSCGRG